MTRFKLLFLFLSFLLGPALQAQEQPREILVTGKQPGPPMWKVSNGEHELWIFAYLNLIPEDIFWESDKVAAVIGRSQEYIEKPSVDVGVSPLVMLNPINLVRGYRLAKRISKNNNGESLEEILPADLYQRFSLLKQQYFPNNKKVENMRPSVAVQFMRNEILGQEGLVWAKDVEKKLKRMIRKNRNIVKTKTEVEMKLKGGFGDLADRVENLMDSLEREKEVNCFSYHVRMMERDLTEMKYRADSWARGYIDDFIGAELPGDADDPCTAMLLASSEQATMLDLMQQSEDLWLSAAVSALENNETTFAVMDISDLLREDGYLSKLQARGYEIRIP